ncbi:MAG: heparinase II/III-family protein [Tannerella sp.]|jgi:hypothetical protein|nr:heparinase II/III-family protein [Tannerella sp.]
MKSLYVSLLLLLSFGMCSQSTHPRIYTTPSRKSAFVEKLQKTPWAQQSFDNLKSNVDPYVERHKTDPQWIISRMQMYWDNRYERVYVKGNEYSHGTGRAPVPTVKFAGNRDWSTDYLMPSIEDTQPYMDAKGMYLQNGKKEGKPWEWVHPSKTGRMIGPMNDRIMSLAADAAFLWWFTGEDKYAVFATDIFMTYIKGMYYRREPFALEEYGNSHLMGLATFEVILDAIIAPLALCYDFAFDYLKEHNADIEMITTVLKRFAEQEIMYGVPDNNWNIFQARFVTYIALALDNNEAYKDGRGRQYYLNEIMNNTTIRQFALKEMIDESFDQKTGLWCESATYSMSVCNDMLDVISLIDNAENNHLLDTFPIIKKAVPATAQYLFPNGRVTAFGDAKYVPLRGQTFEMMIALHRKYSERADEQRLTATLRKLIDDGFYNRNARSLFAMFFYVDKLMDVPSKEVNYKDLQSDFFYAPNVSWLIQRNEADDPANAIVLTLTGAYGNHAHANGISLELYGKGLMLAPESSYGETYGTRDNQEYYARFPAHNTVCVDGISDYGMMRSNYPYTLLASYPAHGERLTKQEKVTFARVSLIEPKTNARQERLTSIVRTSPTTAFTVDIFRSARTDGKDRKHEYFYHSMGGDIGVYDADSQVIAMSQTEELSSASGDMKGYDYFADKQSVIYNKDFKVSFNIPLETQPGVVVDMWMKGFEGRTVFTAKAPKSNAFGKGSVPDELLDKPLPTLIVRQDGEAWKRPFVAVYYPRFEDEPTPCISYFGDNEDVNGVAVKSQSLNRTDYIFNGDSNSDGVAFTHGDMGFKGIYAVVGETRGGAPDFLFLGDGQSLSKGKWSIESKSDNIQASVTISKNGVEVYTSDAVTFRMPASKSPIIRDLANRDAKISGEMLPDKVFSVNLPEGRYIVK